MKYLITGGSGFLGRHLARQLLREGHIVISLARRSSRLLERLGAQQIKGDVLDRAAFAQAAIGADGIFHCAGRVERGGTATDLMRLHVEGARHAVEAAAEAGVARVVFASTSGVVGISADPSAMADDDSPYALALAAKWPYYLSKIYAEKAARASAEDLGVALVIVRPSLLLGPGDRRLSSSGDVLRFLKGQLQVVTPGGMAVVDARDAAQALQLAMQKGRAGEAYLASALNCTVEEFFRRVATLSQLQPPKAVVGGEAARLGARVVEFAARVFGRESPVDRESVEMGLYTWSVDSTKAREELGWSPRDPNETLRDTVKYLRKRFMPSAAAEARAI